MKGKYWCSSVFSSEISKDTDVPSESSKVLSPSNSFVFSSLILSKPVSRFVCNSLAEMKVFLRSWGPFLCVTVECKVFLYCFSGGCPFVWDHPGGF